MNFTTNGVPRGPGRATFLALAMLLLLLVLCFAVASLTGLLSRAPVATPTATAGAAQVAAVTQPAATRATEAAPPAAVTPTRTPSPSVTPSPTATLTATRPPTRTLTPTATWTPTPMCVQKRAGINLRAGPGTLYDPPVGVARAGDQLQPLAFNAKGYTEPNWLKVRVMATGLVAWINYRPEWTECNIDPTRLPAEAVAPPPTFTPTATREPARIECKANPTAVPPGGYSTLTWDVQRVQAVYLDGEGVAGQAQRVVGPLYQTRVYTLLIKTATGDRTCQMTVNVVNAGCTPPPSPIRADATTISPGQCTTVRWDVDGVREVYFDGEGVSGHSYRQVCPSQTRAYTLLVKTSCGDFSYPITITVGAPGPTVIYDFVANAGGASWTNGSGQVLSYPGAVNDTRGFVRLWQGNKAMEDGSTPAVALQTHPQWIDNGKIAGSYSPGIVYRSGYRLRLRVGLLQGASAGRVTFRVSKIVRSVCHGVDSPGYPCDLPVEIVALPHGYAGYLEERTYDLSSLVGYTGPLVLSVTADGSSGQDWAAWTIARIERP